MGLMVVANDKNMKFKCTEYKNGEPYEWQRCIKILLMDILFIIWF